MATIERILQSKGTQVHTIRPERTVQEAIEVLVGQGVGALVVVDDANQIVGIITERDILREVARRAGDTRARRVSDVMTRELIIGLPEDDLSYAMAVMTTNRIRHLPILAHGRLHGIISIGDVVKAQLSEHVYEVRMLTDYIEGRYPR